MQRKMTKIEGRLAWVRKKAATTVEEPFWDEEGPRVSECNAVNS